MPNEKKLYNVPFIYEASGMIQVYADSEENAWEQVTDMNFDELRSSIKTSNIDTFEIEEA